MLIFDKLSHRNGSRMPQLKGLWLTEWKSHHKSPAFVSPCGLLETKGIGISSTSKIL